MMDKLFQILTLLLWSLLLSACGASAYSAADANYERAPYDNMGGAGGSQYTRQAVQMDAPSASQARPDGVRPTNVRPSSGPTNANKPRSGGGISRKFVRNASLTVEVNDEDDFPETLQRAAKIGEATGGYVYAETERSINLRVPTEKLDGVLKQLSKLGEVTDRSVSVRDVTRQYVDLQARIDNLRKMRERLKQLVEQSVSVEEILKVEKELSRVTGELERLEGVMRVMQRDTTYASVRLRLKENVSPGPVGWIFYGTFLAVKWLFVWD